MTAGADTDRARKAVTKHFKDLGLRITIETNIKIVDFLDLTLNLNTGKYKPFRKPNDMPQYVNTSSNHPPVVLKRLPAGIRRRLTDISSDEEVFAEAELPYNEALRKSGYSESVMFLSERKSKQRRDQRKRSQSRKRNITWFTPPFSRNVSTDIARRFLGLVDRHFPRGSDLYKIFNRNSEGLVQLHT